MAGVAGEAQGVLKGAGGEPQDPRAGEREHSRATLKVTVGFGHKCGLLVMSVKRPSHERPMKKF